MKKEEIFLLFLGLVLLLDLPYLVKGVENLDLDNLHYIDGHNIIERMSKIESENGQQKKEIVVLKTTVVGQTKEIEKLNDRVAQLEQFVPINNNKTKAIQVLARPKRPYRLIPSKPKKKTYPNVESKENGVYPFIGPPTNCFDLEQIGYTLNGYYLVKGKDQSNKTRVAVVYCAFGQQQIENGNTHDFQTEIGKVEVKTNYVHFYVSMAADSGDRFIRYQTEHLNIGGAMNKSSGKFTAPVAGTYHFIFNAFVLSPDSNFQISFASKSAIRQNAHVHSQNGSTLFVSLVRSFQLKENDELYVYKSGSGILVGGYYSYSYFTGWLVEEDIKF